jgi:hypothetical protein
MACKPRARSAKQVVCQYNLPSTIVRVVDDRLTKQYGTAICDNTQTDGVAGVTVG